MSSSKNSGVMSTDTASASVLLVCIVAFAATNLHNILVVHRRRTKEKSHAEISRPSGISVNMAALATLILFFETGLYIFLGLSSLIPLSSITLSYQFDLTPYFQLAGLIMTATGYSVFIWSVIARGEYATSWEMRQNHRLVTWGPYRYVRHPSYTAYFLIFISLPVIWSNLLTFLPIIGIPGYYLVTVKEEELLTKRFGNEYIKYQKRTGRFLPRF